MKIVCTSDLHGHLPEIPDCDLLLLCGDYSPNTQTEVFWLGKTFAPWLRELSERMKIIGVAGNHDFTFEEQPYDIVPLAWTYLQDSGTEFGGLKFWGSPWQPRFYDWAFNADEDRLEMIWELIPQDTDVLLLHGPPHGYGDFSPYGQVHTGSPSLLRRIEQVKPKLVVAGHIHSGYGRYMIGDTIFVNASHVNEQYKPTNPPVVIEL